jgi:hypothetical protein
MALALHRVGPEQQGRQSDAEGWRLLYVGATVKILMWGEARNGACSHYRGGQFYEVWRSLGHEVKNADIHARGELVDASGKPVDEGATPAQLRERMADGTWRLDVAMSFEPIEWADVIFFRRDYSTNYACSLDPDECDFRTEDPYVAMQHKHKLRPRKDSVTPPVFRELLKLSDRPAIVYDSDDYLISDKKMRWNGLWADFYAHRHLALEMAQGADLLTVSTPGLEKLYRHTNPNRRVIRNAIQPEWYVTELPRPERPKPLLLYYGSAVRMRDFAGYPNELTRKLEGGFAAKAVADLAHELDTMFMGCEEGWESEVKSAGFKHIVGFTRGLEKFANALTATHADIGIAPLLGDEFDSGKSELHWLEFTMIGAATLASEMRGGGPYNMIRHGVDGMLAHGRQDWYDGLKRLIREPNLRADIVAGARERVLAEYDYHNRALEWLSAFEWAIANKRPPS